MKWDPEIGQLGWREIWVDLGNNSPNRVEAELFCTSGPRNSGAGLMCYTLLTYRDGYDYVDPSTFGSFIDCINTAEEKLTYTRSVKRRLATNLDITWLFQLWDKKSRMCHGKWLSIIKKDFLKPQLISWHSYEKLETLIEPFLPHHPLNRYREQD